MGIEDARALANRWSETLSAASRNLVDFSASELCLLAKARLRPDHPTPYTGLTLSKGIQARAELDSLLQDYLPLARVVEEAQAAAQRGGMLVSHDKQEKIVLDLLLGRSVKLNAPPAASQGSRDLLQGARPDDFCTPEQALQSMQRRFAAAHDQFVAIHQAQEAFSAKAAAFEARRADAERRARESGSDPSALAALSREAFTLDGRDPLGSMASIDKARAALERAESELRAKAKEASDSKAAVDQAALALSSLRAACARAHISRDEARALIDLPGPLPEPSSHDALAFLEQWKSKLAATREAGRHGACLVGAAKLSSAIADQAELTARALAACRAPLDELADLRGRHDAFAAKARALEAKGAAVSPSVWQLHCACGAELAKTPASLPAIRKLVGAFEACVAALGS